MSNNWDSKATNPLDEALEQATYSHEVQDFDWIVLHKGSLSKLYQSFLRRTVEQSLPVFANEVFVVLTNRAEPPLKLLSAAVNPDHLHGCASRSGHECLSAASH